MYTKITSTNQYVILIFYMDDIMFIDNTIEELLSFKSLL